MSEELPFLRTHQFYKRTGKAFAQRAARAGWIKPVKKTSQGRGGITIWNLDDVRMVEGRIACGELPPLLPCEVKWRETHSFPKVPRKAKKVKEADATKSQEGLNVPGSGTLDGGSPAAEAPQGGKITRRNPEGGVSGFIPQRATIVAQLGIEASKFDAGHAGFGTEGGAK